MTSRPDRTLRNVDRQFWNYCRRNELWLQRCPGCQTYKWPPTAECDTCTETPLDWKRLSGNGSVRSSCLYERQYFDQCLTPWLVILVELDEGPLFLSNPSEFDSESVQEGARVRVRFIDASDGEGPYRLPVFERILGSRCSQACVRS